MLTLSGSTAMVPLLEQLAEGFQARHRGVTAIVEGEGAAVGLARVVEGAADLAAVAGSPPQGTWAAPIAVDGIAVIVHADHPLQSLTLSQLYDLFSGRVWQWSELGVRVAEDEVTVVSREEGSGTRAAFEALVMAPGSGCPPISALKVGAAAPEERAPPGTPPCAPDPVTSTAVMMLDSAAVVAYVASHPGAIGYVAHGHLLPSGTGAPPVQALRIEGVAPLPQQVADGSYPLSLPYALVAPQEPAGAARQFVDYCLSAEGQAIVARGYVPVRD